MSDTVLKHPLVREYLRGLATARAALPAAQARELREQIAAHLDEALPPDASNAEVQAELARLGSPGSLAAAPAGQSGPHLSQVGEPLATAQYLWLRVRVGVITRTEDVSTVQAFALTGGKIGPCT